MIGTILPVMSINVALGKDSSDFGLVGDSGVGDGNEVETRVTVGILVSPTFSPSLSSFIFDDVLVFVFVFFFEVPSFALFKEDFFFVFFSSSNPDFSARGSNILSSFIVFR